MGRKVEPWFKFWAADYLTDPDVDELSLDAQGLLVRMWCVCSQRGNIPDDPEEIARLTRCKSQCVSQCVSQCKPFFKLQDGLLYSGRMEAEKARSAKARASAESRYKKESSAPGAANDTAKRSANRTANRTAKKARKPEENTLDIYLAYPKHVGKAQALKAIEKAIHAISPTRDAQWLLDRTLAYAQTRKGEEEKFTPHPSTWFNGGRYDDDSPESHPARAVVPKNEVTGHEFSTPIAKVNSLIRKAHSIQDAAEEVVR